MTQLFADVNPWGRIKDHAAPDDGNEASASGLMQWPTPVTAEQVAEVLWRR
jgi:hypothetical protein